MSRRLATTALVTTGLYAIILFHATSPLGLAFGLVGQAAFALPGVLMVRAVAGASAGWLAPVAFGPVIGYSVSSITLMVLWALGGRAPWVLAAAPAMALALLPLARRLRGRWELMDTEPGDLLALTALLALVPIVVGWPFAHVGEPINGHLAYRAYFTADYVWRRAVVAELAKGEFLPLNPFYADDPMHYYWLPHLISAVEYRTSRDWQTLDQLLLTRSILADAAFMGFLYGLARVFRARPWSAALGSVAAILCTSYEGLYVLARDWWYGMPSDSFRYVNVDAMSRWDFQSMPVDGLQRLLLYQPHHAAGYAVGLLGLVAVARRRRAYDPAVFGAAGLLLGLSLLISSFAGLMVTVAAAAYEGVSVLAARAWRRAVVHAVSAALPLAAAAGTVLALHYVDEGGQVITLVINGIATHNFFIGTVLSAGPVVIIGAAAAAAAWRAGRADLRIVATMIAVSTLFYFFVDIRDHQHVYVGWRVGHFVFILSATLAALVFERVAAADAARRRWLVAALVLVLVPALATPAIDIYNTQDVWNWSEGPGFRWTLLLTPEDQQLFDWLQQNTSIDALVQVDPIARDTHTWAYLPGFAERRMAVGVPISMVPLAKYIAGSEEVAHLYDLPARQAYDEAVRHQIDYLVVGEPERQAHDGVEQRLDTLPVLLPLVLRNATISVYKVMPEI